MFPAFVKLIDRQKAYQESSSSGVLDVPETLGDGVGRVETSLGVFLASLKMIGWEKACQDSSCPPSLLLESWRTWMFLRHLELVSKGLGHSQDWCLKVLYVFEECRNHKIHWNWSFLVVQKCEILDRFLAGTVVGMIFFRKFLHRTF